MSRKALSLLIVIIGTALIIVGVLFTQSNKNATTKTSTATFTAAEVSEHASANDCWTIIDGAVYDVTSYIPIHPGGVEILRACGNDGTTLFTDRTTKQGDSVGSGTSHSNYASSRLQAFHIGDLDLEN